MHPDVSDCNMDCILDKLVYC